MSVPKVFKLSEKDKEYSRAWQIDQDQKDFAFKLKYQILEEVEKFKKSKRDGE